MNVILQSLASYAAPQVIKFISQNIPKLAAGISIAQSQGYTPSQVLNFLGKKLKPTNKRAAESQANEYERYLSRIGIKTKAEREDTRNKFLSGALGVGAGALGLYARANQANNLLNVAPNQFAQNVPAQARQQALLPPPQNAAITNVPSPMPPIGPSAGAAVPQPINVSKNGLPPQKSLQISQPPPQMQAPATSSDSASILDNLGLRIRIEKMRHKGHTPEMITQVAEKMVPSEFKGKFPIKDVIKDYLSKPPTTQLGKLPEGKGLNFKGILEPFEDKPINPKDYERQSEDVKPLDRGSLVITPNGKVSEIKAKTGSDFIVDAGGKGVKHNASDLEEEPADVANIVENILKIPEVDRSSIVSLFTYDPDDKTMYIQYHNGETYKYIDVDPETVKEVAEKNGTPVSEGKGTYGAWSPEDKKSLGAALIHKFIRDPKYAKPKKGEPANPNYKKLETFYDYWEKLRKKPKNKIS